MAADWCVRSSSHIQLSSVQLAVLLGTALDSLQKEPPAHAFPPLAFAGQTAEALGDLERAVASYESALRHNAYSIVALSQIAAICRSKEEFKKAAEYFGRVVGIAPESGDVWGALGECHCTMTLRLRCPATVQGGAGARPRSSLPSLSAQGTAI